MTTPTTTSAVPPATLPTLLRSVIGLPTTLGVVVVLIVGGILACTGTLTWHAYQHDAAVLIGLLAVGHGIDRTSHP